MSYQVTRSIHSASPSQLEESFYEEEVISGVNSFLMELTEDALACHTYEPHDPPSTPWDWVHEPSRNDVHTESPTRLTSPSPFVMSPSKLQAPYAPVAVNRARVPALQPQRRPLFVEQPVRHPVYDIV